MKIEFQIISILFTIFLMFVISKYSGKIIHEDWFYAGQISRSHLKRQNFFDVNMHFDLKSQHSITGQNTPIKISGEDIRSSNTFSRFICEAKQANGDSKEGRLIFYFNEQINCGYLFNWDEITGNDKVRFLEFLHKNYDIDLVKVEKIEKRDNSTIKVFIENKVISLKLNKTKSKVNLKISDGRTEYLNLKEDKGKLYVCCEECIEKERNFDSIEKFYLKVRKIIYKIPEEYAYYKWASKSLLPSTYYEKCLIFENLKNNIISTNPSISITIKHDMISLDTLKLRIDIDSKNQIKAPYINLFKCNLQLKSSEFPSMNVFELKYSSEFLFKIPNVLSNDIFLTFNIKLTNEDYLLGDLELKLITGIGPLGPRKFNPIKKCCDYEIEIKIESELIKNILKKDFLYGIDNNKAINIARMMISNFSVTNKVETKVASLYLINYFISVQELAPIFLKDSILKLIEGFEIIKHTQSPGGNSLDNELMKSFIIKDAFDKANKLFIEDNLFRKQEMVQKHGKT